MQLYTIVRHFQKSIGRRGVLGTLTMVPLVLLRKSKEILLFRRRSYRRATEAEQEFDRTYGIDTSQIVELSALDIRCDSWVHGVRYQPIGPGEFRQLIEPAGISFDKCTFIDFGCGKGRALALASEYSFRRIIGVEFSVELYHIAGRNIRTLHAPAQQCDRIEVVNMDALEYPLPNESLVIYLNNPFGVAVMRPLVSRIEASWWLHNRPIIVLYHTPECADVWRRSSVFREAMQRAEFSIFKTIDPPTRSESSG